MSKDPIVPGFRWAGLEAGIRKRPGRPDLALLLADGPVACAGLFTTNSVTAAPVNVSRPRAAAGLARAVLMNAGCANACTGEAGTEAAVRMAAALEPTGIPSDEVLIASTGVIGAPLPIEKIEAAAPALLDALRPDGVRDFARAICTTDTFEKVAHRQGHLAGRTVTVVGVAKGAGMIQPNMATMLGCIATDANIEAGPLLELLRAAAHDSFHCLTVDGDMSTNDTVYLLASGKAGHQPIREARGPAFDQLLELVRGVCLDLTKAIARDGEGATKLVEVRVEEAYSEEEADRIARKIANSPLVKTAWHAADANWGRIMGAIGASGVSVDGSLVSISVDGADLVDQGVGLGPDAEAEATVQMQKPSFTVLVKLGRGVEGRSIYTCDFSADYVKINAEYRT
jgi:glutamate N-acetyltransferase / amino-acid N-acetyltransferase